MHTKEKIDSKDISVVVQGAINPYTIRKTLRSIRKHLPEAQIIISTWEGTDTSDFKKECDAILLNKDPGAYVFTPSGQLQNQNRQILSTQNGIKRASRKYVLKIRSDMKIMGTKFLSYYGKYLTRNPECKILKERVLINSVYTRKSIWEKADGSVFPILFHPSDWMMFGLKEDMLKIWDIPLAPEPETSQYFKNHPELPHDKLYLTRWHAEQYIWMMCLKKNGLQFDFDSYMSLNDELKYLSELSIANNFTLLEYKQEFDILCLKYLENDFSYEVMHSIDWLELYKKYCDSSFNIPQWKYLQAKIFRSPYLNLMLRKAKRIKEWMRKVICFNWFFDIVSLIKYICIYLYEILVSALKCIFGKCS